MPLVGLHVSYNQALNVREFTVYTTVKYIYLNRMLLFGLFYVVNRVLTGGWKEDLLEAIDADVLPVIYGGTRTDEDGDPRCRNLVRYNFLSEIR